MADTHFTDAELIALLEQFVRRNAVVLWAGEGEFPGKGTQMGGIGLHNRTLRKALVSLAKAQKREVTNG